MSEHSAIGWTNATWNPVTGCSHVSPGCVNCYAETLSLRMGWSKKPWTAQNAAENVTLHPERLAAPLRWRTPRMVFVNSMSDLFHERVPEAFIDQVFAMMALTPKHTFQVLTKRPERMRDYVNNGLAGDDLAVQWPLPNVWLGVSVEDQRRADERIPLLLDTPAIVRFVSAEPLLGAITFGAALWSPWGLRRLDWVIIGGESGRGYREMCPEWAEGIATECAKAGCAVFVKQDSGSRPGKQGRLSDALWARKEYPVSA